MVSQRALVFACVVGAAVAFSAPRSIGVAQTARLAEPKAAAGIEFGARQLAAAPALTALLAAAPANAFSAAYLPAILVPVMTLFLPVIGMGLFTLLTQKDEI
mmetsp:Transcript_5280/g.15674  ORF Transcript_5280/g.15674 Transcript_5280/m.15674 type:complete len:102 (+) Transcript_5280:94-399(+)|eukprot:CAMPEP_0119272354 /NCGR_PEP_ID=MMETSP1329-20130426/8565_1 /TAXON_ID=114041 /ORGANISM="Genus nov. species nov., Strain RCC1024" /LENGTH=101 /DNA_ID=CAMNT_0007272417 /DNA_START=99 /DNA_END=404 /DNA_ORIENTATION=+